MLFACRRAGFGCFLAACLMALGSGFSAWAAEHPLTPEEARQKLGEQVWVQMQVASAKDRLEKRGEIYLDSQMDFRSEKNLAVVITRRGAESLRGQGILSPAEHFNTKEIRVKGTVKEVDGVRRIEVDDAGQLELAQ